MPGPTIRQTAPVIKVNGAELPSDILNSLTHVEVDRGVNLVGRMTLKFVETGFDLAAQPKFALGTTVALTDGAGVSLMSGEVTAISLDQGSAYGPASTELTVTVDDKAYRLGQTTRHTTHLKVKYSDVILKAARETGLNASIVDTGETHEYLLQSGTDLAYLDWISDRIGLLWWVDDNTLKVVKPGTSSGTTTVRLGEDLIRLSTRASGRHAGRVTVTGWDEQQQATISETTTAPNRQESDLVAKYPGRGGQPGDGISVPAWPATTSEATAVSAAMVAQSTSAAVTTRGTCLVNSAIRPGSTVSVQNAGPATGSYYVTRVQHVYGPGGFDTHFTAGPIRPDALVDLLGPAPTSPGTQIAGLVIGIVTNVDDEKKWGRVKVQFPTLGGEIESTWARVVTIGGGAQRGAVFAPEVNDEVLVGFEQGDTRRPVIIGGLFSEKNKLPSTDNVEQGSVTYRRITSRLGHYVELGDGGDEKKQHILLQLKGDQHKIRLGKDKLEIAVPNKPVSITNGPAKIEFSANGDITIEGNSVTIKAKQGAIKAEATTGEVAVKGMAVKADASTNLALKSGGVGTVEATGMMAVKGATVAIN